MGTMITLGVGKLEISWDKNNIFDNFCDLFQPEDWKDIKYYYTIQKQKHSERNLIKFGFLSFLYIRTFVKKTAVCYNVAARRSSNERKEILHSI